MKRLITVLVCIAMVMGMMIVPVAAATTAVPTVTVETVPNEVQPGDTVELAVTIANNPGFTNFEWHIVFDESKLALQSINTSFEYEIYGQTMKIPYLPDTAVVENVNTKYITCAGAVPIMKEDGETLFTLTFVVNDGSVGGDTEVKIESDHFAVTEKDESTEKDVVTLITAEYVPGTVTIAGDPDDDNTGDDNTGDDNTGDDTTGGSTTGGSTTGGSTTGGSTTGGSTTGGSTTGGSTTGGSTTGGSTTGGSTTGGSTTGGSTTGGSTTGGSTTGGSTTGGSTTGGSTTGGSTTGGSTTGGSTTGGSTTGGSTTGGSTTPPVIDVTDGDPTNNEGEATWEFKDDGDAKIVTVEHDVACVVIIQQADGTLIPVKAIENDDGSYDFDVSEMVEGASIIIVVKGDFNLDGEVDMTDATGIMNAWVNDTDVKAIDEIAADVDETEDIDMTDATAIMNAWVNNTSFSW